MAQLLTGHLLRFVADPFTAPIKAAVVHDTHGAIRIEDGRIAAAGPVDTVDRTDAEHIDLGDRLLIPGFVDAHMHYPQTGIIAAWGKRLIDWLNTYTFPEEMRFGDPTYARKQADLTLDLALAHGTTTLTSFCTIHPASVDAWFEAAAARNMATVAGKTCMDRNAPDGLRDTPQSAYDDSAALLAKWHGTGRARYAITPRFTPTSTPDQLEALGALWAANPSCAMQTHLSEQRDEIAWVRDLHPEASDYLQTYEQHGLIGPGALFGHAIHLEPRERDLLRETGSAVVHCPTSNTFIGSGLFDAARTITDGITTGLATDTGGGSSFSMLRTMAAAYEIGQLSGTALHPAQLLWLATEGSARALRMQDRTGTLAPGSDADIIALDLSSTPAIAQRSGRAENIWEAIFPTIMMGDDRAIADVWVAGERVARTPEGN
ncbi:Guanine deaminase [Rhodobacteraceae bacterium THAF1]|uniref:guanine deaminase n=1 Tax=Palleronia sp. THAF1 TaxID=2587842 RepID=UPI000F3DD266|nr:guanine deaminase [Palleronia sp. THAF1]QFU07967.1 Guanine deaminase [Palleronia sp. THAF1]VDC27818.1 Guanine deaminase [Rhodobacteraceae bacterium THAF1]